MLVAGIARGQFPSVSSPPGGSSFIPVTVLHTLSLRASTAAGPLALTNFASGNIVVIFLDGEGVTIAEPTISWSDGTTSTLVSSGLIGGTNNVTTYVATLASAAPTVTISWPVGVTFSGILAIEFPSSLVTATIDTAGSARNCCNTGNPPTAVVLTTTASDIIVSLVGFNSSNDSALCPPSMAPAGRSIGNDAAYACFGVAPVAVTGLPVGFSLITDTTNAMQVVALKHQ